jgi:long-subunit acyl-CoA synthetase (AMP-forming)
LARACSARSRTAPSCAAGDEAARVEPVKRIAIVDADWLPGGNELTLIVKLKRKPILQKYASEIEQLYGWGAGDVGMSPNSVTCGLAGNAQA